MNKIKIVSGGQTGADRAGLDAAIELGLEYGGWVPLGRKAEDGAVPECYTGMSESRSADYRERTKANVRDSDATLIITAKLPLSRGTLLTRRTAENLLKPNFVACIGAPNALEETRRWLESFQQISRPFVLNVAGPRESGSPGIQELGKAFLVELLRQ